MVPDATTEVHTDLHMELHRRIAALKAAGPRLTPGQAHSQMDAIRLLAASQGLATLERLAGQSARRAMMPGHRIAIRSCLEHMEDALNSGAGTACTAILAAVAVRLH